MKKSKQLFSLVITLGAAAFLTACGSGNNNQASSTDLSSRLPVTTSSTEAKPLAYCNQATGTEISAKLKVYSDSTNTIRADYVYAQLTALPANFKDDKSYIAMWKWLSNASGYTYLDSNALKFMLVDPTNNQPLTKWVTTLRWNDVVTIASGMGTTDPKTFFGKVNILVDLNDAQGQYDVLKITHYDLATNKAVSQVDGLLPLFYANPADYAYEANGQTRSSVLQGLHPFKNYNNQGYTAAQFASMAQGFCF